MDIVLQALVEPRRREIMRLLQDQERTAGEISAYFSDVTRPAISQHLKVLTVAGLITMRRAGTRRIYQARPEGLAELRKFLDEFWSASLQGLKRQAETDERRAKKRGDKRK